MNRTLDRLAAALADRYRVEGELGAGGMATVYLAHDLKHQRDVAIKVLHPDLGAALGAERFLSEIRTTARLQHPHILPLLDSGETHDEPEATGTAGRTASGLLYYVMPLVTGETLRARLERERQLPIADAVRIAREVASALDYAHRQGVIHRDIKPENVLLHDGQAIVADFGIALAVQQAGGQRLTQTGLSLGTPQYMSPEQAMGERVIDARSDVYALGAMTYEMLTGDPPFTGSSVQSIVAKVLADRPAPIRTTRDTVSQALEYSVLTALAKLPADRYATAAQFADALLSTTTPFPAPSFGVMSGPSRSGWRQSAMVATAALAVVAPLAWWVGRVTPPPAESWTAFAQLTDASGVETSPALSPDGESFAYASNARGTWDIYVQRVGGRNPVLVAGDTAADESWPAYSADGKQLAFARRGDGIWVMGATGESAHRITSFGTMPSWSPDGKRLVFGGEDFESPYNVNTRGELWTVAATGGAPQQIVMTGKEWGYQPAWSPSGKRIAFFAVTDGQRDIKTVAVAGGAPVSVTNDAALDWTPTWSADGRFLYFASDRGGAMGIWRIAIDDATGAVRGAPELIASGADAWYDLPHVSRDGRAILFRSKIESVNPAAATLDLPTGRVSNARLLQHRTGSLLPTDVSRDGEWLALMSPEEPGSDLWVMRTDGRDLRRITDDTPRDFYPRFTPDGRAVTFFSNRLGRYEGFRVGVDGSGLTPLTNFNSGVFFTVFAPDGKRLAMSGIFGGPRIADGPWPVTEARTTPLGPKTLNGRTVNLISWSADSRYVAGYLDLPSGDTRGHMVLEVATGVAKQLNDDSRGYPIEWLPDARHVVYFTSNGTLVRQNVVTMARDTIRGDLLYSPDDISTLSVAPDGRTLYFGAREVQANLWMVRVGASAAAKK